MIRKVICEDSKKSYNYIDIQDFNNVNIADGLETISTDEILCIIKVIIIRVKSKKHLHPSI